MSRYLRVEIPLTLPSGANLREHWATRAKRMKAQRNAVILARHGGSFLPAIAATTRGETLVCTLTRISPRKLDSDNLAFAFKAVRDQIAAELGVNDGSDAVRWEYAQEWTRGAKGKAAIRIEIAKVPCTCDEATKNWRDEDRWSLCGHLPSCPALAGVRP